MNVALVHLCLMSAIKIQCPTPGGTARVNVAAEVCNLKRVRITWHCGSVLVWTLIKLHLSLCEVITLHLIVIVRSWAVYMYVKINIRCTCMNDFCMSAETRFNALFWRAKIWRSTSNNCQTHGKYVLINAPFTRDIV